MSVHIHDAEGRDVGFICTGVNNRYIVRARWAGYRTYEIKGRHRSRRAAILAMAKVFADGQYKRVDVILTADYYEPTMVCELVQS